MAQRLLLEGTDIDELLARVRAEHGPDARIVHAEQKLVGGIAGFFAKRRFEVAVAADQVEDPASRTTRASSPARSTAVPAPTFAQEAPPVTTFDTQSQPGGNGPTSLEDLLAMADHQDGQRPPGRPLSTETSSFDHLVRDLVARAEPDNRAAPVAFVPAQGGFSAAVPRILSEVAAEPAGPTPTAPVGIDDSVVDWMPEPDLPALALPQLEPESFGMAAHDLYPPAQFPQGTARFAAPLASPVLAPVAAAPVAAPRAVPRPEPMAALPVERQYMARHSGRPLVVPQSVADLGLPVRALSPEPQADPRVALLDVLADLAVAAPTRLGRGAGHRR